MTTGADTSTTPAATGDEPSQESSGFGITGAIAGAAGATVGAVAATAGMAASAVGLSDKKSDEAQADADQTAAEAERATGDTLTGAHKSCACAVPQSGHCPFAYALQCNLHPDKQRVTMAFCPGRVYSRAPYG